MAAWLTSDNHFGHANIIEYSRRPFSSLHEMHKTMTERWNETVKPDDTVYHLGDFAMGTRGKFQTYLEQLNGAKVLIRGNHDRGAEFMQSIGFAAVFSELYLTLDSTRLYLRHRPAFTDAWKTNADFMFCGHVHTSWRRRGNIINVGVDQWDFRPQSLVTLIAASTG